MPLCNTGYEEKMRMLRKKGPCNRLWRPIGVSKVEDLTLSSQLAHNDSKAVSLMHWLAICPPQI
jgi:hypothetical protein